MSKRIRLEQCDSLRLANCTSMRKCTAVQVDPYFTELFLKVPRCRFDRKPFLPGLELKVRSAVDIVSLHKHHNR